MIGDPSLFTLSPDQKGIETLGLCAKTLSDWFTLSPDQKGIEKIGSPRNSGTLPCSQSDTIKRVFTLSWFSETVDLSLVQTYPL